MATGPYAYSTTAADNGTASSEITWSDSMNAASVDNSSRQMMADSKKLILDQGGALTLAGSANTYTLTTNAATDTLADGMRVHAVVNATNTGASTLNVNSKGALAIRTIEADGVETALTAGILPINYHAVFQYDASANSAAGAWIFLNPPAQIKRSTVVTTTGGTSITFTGIPSTARMVILSFYGLSLSGTDNLQLRIGNSGGLVTSGYTSERSIIDSSPAASAVAISTGFSLGLGNASAVASGHFMLFNLTGNIWTCTGSLANVATVTTWRASVTGYQDAGGVLDRVAILTTGSNTFDANSGVNVLWM